MKPHTAIKDAHVYAEGVQRGAALVIVKASDACRERIDTLLDNRRVLHAVTRGGVYRQASWTEFDPCGEP